MIYTVNLSLNGKHLLKRQLQLLVVDHSARWSRKNAASCVNRCKMQDTPSTRHSNAHCSLGHTLASFVWASLISQTPSKDHQVVSQARYSWPDSSGQFKHIYACHFETPVRVESQHLVMRVSRKRQCRAFGNTSQKAWAINRQSVSLHSCERVLTQVIQCCSVSNSNLIGIDNFYNCYC